MRYPAYTHLQRTGRSPLTCLPAHWGQRRLRFLVSRIEQGWSPQCENQPADDDGWGVMKVGCVNGSGFDAGENKALPAEVEPLMEFELRPGDVLVSRANTRELVGSAALVPDNVRTRLLLCDKLFRLNPSADINPRYLVYVLRTPAARFHYERDATGASGSMQNIGQDTLKDVLVPLPPVEEQEHIANFLDWKTGQVDALIGKKWALVERLREQRFVQLVRIVSGQLSSRLDPELSKDQWFGSAPAHWAHKRLKWAVSFQRGHDLPSEARGDGVIPVVSSAGVSGTHCAAAANGPGIVTGRYGTIGDFHLITEDYWPLNTTLYSIDLHGNVPEYLCMLLEYLKPLFLMNAKKSAVPGVDRNDLHNIDIALPPIEEQHSLVKAFSSQHANTMQMIAAVEGGIARLAEYRSALITAAVTGRINVRSVAVPAPV